MDGNHMMEIVGNLIEMILCNAKFDKPAVRDLLAKLGWTDEDLEYFNAAWMFKEVDEEMMSTERAKEILMQYVDNDLNSADPDYVREVLYNLCTEDELKELGFWDWLGFEEEDE